MIVGIGVRFSDIAGLENAKGVLKEAIIYSIKTPFMFVGITPTKDCLLYGPPGTSKTKLVKAIS